MYFLITVSFLVSFRISSKFVLAFLMIFPLFVFNDTFWVIKCLHVDHKVELHIWYNPKRHSHWVGNDEKVLRWTHDWYLSDQFGYRHERHRLHSIDIQHEVQWWLWQVYSQWVLLVEANFLIHDSGFDHCWCTRIRHEWLSGWPCRLGNPWQKRLQGSRVGRLSTTLLLASSPNSTLWAWKRMILQGQVLVID